MEEHIKFADSPMPPTAGSAGIHCHLPGCASTVSTVAGATGGIAPGNMVETGI